MTIHTVKTRSGHVLVTHGQGFAKVRSLDDKARAFAERWVGVPVRFEPAPAGLRYATIAGPWSLALLINRTENR